MFSQPLPPGHMEPPIARFAPRPATAAGVLLAVFCGFWFVSAMGWIPAIFGDYGEIATWPGRDKVAISAQPVPAPDAGGSKNRIACARCGVIELVRQVERTRDSPGVVSLSGEQAGEVMAALHMVLNAMAGNSTRGVRRPARSYEITVLFHDGSRRILTETDAPAWKPGDPVKVINGRIKPDA